MERSISIACCLQNTSQIQQPTTYSISKIPFTVFLQIEFEMSKVLKKHNFNSKRQPRNLRKRLCKSSILHCQQKMYSVKMSQSLVWYMLVHFIREPPSNLGEHFF